MKQRLRQSAEACLFNGRRLLLEAEYLEYEDPASTPYFLAQIAQEEFAKAFLLALVVRDVIPWDQRLLRASRDHTCKQLLRVVMDYLSPDHEEFGERIEAWLHRKEIREVPAKVIDAIAILRHEKIGRWVDSAWVWADEPSYDRETFAIAKGSQDRVKQDQLYVRLARDGSVASVPRGMTGETAKMERDRASRLAALTEAVLAGDAYPALDYDKIEDVFRALFASVVDDA